MEIWVANESKNLRISTKGKWADKYRWKYPTMVPQPFASHNYANVTVNLLCLNKQSDVINKFLFSANAQSRSQFGPSSLISKDTSLGNIVAQTKKNSWFSLPLSSVIKKSITNATFKR